MSAWSEDVRVADWIVRRLHPFGQDVGSFVPAGFSAYARILHPLPRGLQHRAAPRWRDVAASADRELTATAGFEEIRPEAAGELQPPLGGTLEPAALQALVPLLARATARPERCWFGFWEGFAGLGIPPGARIAVEERPLALCHGPIEAAVAFADAPLHQSPTLWWPEDRAWCVATEVDFHSTYVGGSAELCEQITRAPGLEALSVALDEVVTD